ncbi:MAG: ABC transporter substrate-binding protein [Anaerolineaceae bacterium]|nr:ABC transporter substrate-binding protein [Anaerolineaceae bacterium]
MSEKAKMISRRNFLKAAAMTAVGIYAAACAPSEQQPAAEPTKAVGTAPTAAAPEKVTYKEAPMLAELVKGGKLPPVEERLPKEPYIQQVTEEIGVYGGTLHVGDKNPTCDRYYREPLLEFSPDGSAIGPLVFTKWELSSDLKEWTFKIREGLKWSDGQPMTSDDYVFWWNDVLSNKEITPTFPSTFKAGGEPGTLTKVDDYTFKMVFKAAYPVLAIYLAQPRLINPKHYCQKFHAAYVDKATLDKMVADAKFERWDQLFGAKCNSTNPILDNPELPTWNIYNTITPMTDPNYAASRNPYYFKVDPEGNQLPYIDKVAFAILKDDQLFVSKAIAGEFDLQFMQLGWAANHPVLKENESKGGYRVLNWQQSLGNSSMIMYNQSYEADPVVAKYIQDKKFRQSVSVALDREEINKVIYFGKGSIRQATVIDSSPDFKPEYATKYLAYEPAKANQWLDEIGLDKKDAEGYRIAPETGQALTIIFSIQPPMASAEAGELIAAQLKKVGIKLVINIEDNALHYQKMASNDLQMSIWSMDTAWYPAWLTYAYWIVPFVQASSRIGPAIGQWRDSGGTAGKQPTGEMAKALEIFDQALVEGDEAKRIELASQVLEILSENLWSTGTVVLPDHDIVVKNTLRNVPETGISDWLMRTMKNARPEQFFFKA